MKQIRVAEILNCGNIGGAERSVEWFAQANDRSKFDLHFIFLYSGGPIEVALSSMGYSTKILNWKNGFSFSGRLKLAKAIEDIAPDLIHDHSQTPASRVFMKFAKRVPILSTQHGDYFMAAWDWRLPFLILDDRVTALVMANSNFSSRRHASVFHRSPSKIRTVYLGIRADDYRHPRPKRVALPSRTRLNIAFVGRLEEYKGTLHIPLLAKELLNRGQEFVINVIGDGPARGACEELARRTGVAEALQFSGWQSDIRASLHAADLLLFLSVWDEPFGLVLLEAIAAGLPVFAYAGGAVDEILRDAPYSWQAPKGDYRQLAQLIVEKRDICISRDMLAGYNYIKDRYDISRTMGELEQLYDGYAAGNVRQ